MPRHKMPLEQVIAQKQEADSVRQLEQILSIQGSPAKLVGANGEATTIPESVYQVLRQVVHAMALGQAISIAPQEHEMTTQQAADILNVSRPHLVKLLEQEEIPYIKVGSHRRVRYQDLMIYKQRRDTKRSHFLDELIQESQDMGFYE